MTMSLIGQSRHPGRVGECPLSGVKRTPQFDRAMSACDPKQTSRCHRSMSDIGVRAAFDRANQPHAIILTERTIPSPMFVAAVMSHRGCSITSPFGS